MSKRAVVVVEILDHGTPDEFHEQTRVILEAVTEVAKGNDNLRAHLAIDKAADDVMGAFPPPYTHTGRKDG